MLKNESIFTLNRILKPLSKMIYRMKYEELKAPLFVIVTIKIFLKIIFNKKSTVVI